MALDHLQTSQFNVHLPLTTDHLLPLTSGTFPQWITVRTDIRDRSGESTGPAVKVFILNFAVGPITALRGSPSASGSALLVSPSHFIRPLSSPPPVFSFVDLADTAGVGGGG